MHYSGVLVVTDHGRLNECAEQIDDLAGVEVRLRYPDKDTLILVQLSETSEEQEQGLRAIRAIPGVQLANPVWVGCVGSGLEMQHSSKCSRAKP